MKIESINAPNGDLIVEFTGEMDALGCTEVRPELEKIVQTKNPNIFLDLKEVSFLDSSGIGAIVFLFKRLNAQQRKLAIVGVQGQPEELMQLLRIDIAIPVNKIPVSDLRLKNPLQEAS
jgi:anti-anti-sigma factor